MTKIQNPKPVNDLNPPAVRRAPGRLVLRAWLAGEFAVAGGIEICDLFVI